jgi:hypothetical protein
LPRQLPAVRSGRLGLALLLGAAVAPAPACRGSGQEKADPAQELQRLERVLAETADLRQHPTLTDGDLDPLRQLKLLDPRAARARSACVRQYELIVQAQDEVARCKDLEAMLEARMHDLSGDAGDPAILIDEAQQACARATTALNHVARARRECDDLTGALRRDLGQPK